MSSKGDVGKLDRVQKELATFGYIRTSSIYSVPIAISKLCLQYFDQVFYVLIRGKKLKEFLKMKNGEYITKSFKYNNDISFEIGIYPNGEIEEENGFTMLVIKALLNKSKISNIIYKYDMKCIETNSHFTNCAFDDDHYGWNANTMQLSKYADLKELVFTVYIDIDFIEYKQIENWMKPLTMHQKVSYSSKFDNKLVEEMKICERDKSFQSDLFDDDCWKLVYVPNGFGQFNEIYNVLITLLRIPSGIKKLCAHIKISISGSDEYFEEDGFFDYEENSWPMDEIGNDKEKVLKSMQFDVEITINELLNDKDEIVPQNKWNDLYNIIS